MMCSTPGILSGPVCAGFDGFSSGGAFSTCPVSAIDTSATPAPFSAPSAFCRTASHASASFGGTSMTKRTAPPSPTVSARTTPADTISPPRGASTPFRSSRTSSRVAKRITPDP